jgi:hypothetical protein
VLDEASGFVEDELLTGLEWKSTNSLADPRKRLARLSKAPM